MAESNNNSEKNEQVKPKDLSKTSFANEQQDNMSQSEISANTKSIKTKFQDFYKTYKNEISLAVLILYVITLAAATIIELIEH